MTRTIVVTGGSDGVGAAAARALAGQPGAEVVVVGRSAEKTAAVARKTGAEHHLCDFSSLRQVRELAATLAARHPRIDVLCSNAGAIFSRREVTEDGFERTLQVNHLAPFLLTESLLPQLRAGDGVVVSTASAAARVGRIDLNDLGLSRRWSPMRAYAASKLMNLVAVRGLVRRYAAEGISAVALHPGVVASGFWRSDGGMMARLLSLPLVDRFSVTPDEGADTLVWLARGRAGVDWRPGEMYGRRTPMMLPEQARDDAFVDRFYEASTLLVSSQLRSMVPLVRER